MSQKHAEGEEIELEWEEWDGKSPFLHHCIAGSMAGVAEHVLLYPVDTVKTHMQAYCSTCPNNPANKGLSPSSGSKAVCTGPPATSGTPSPKGMWSTATNLINHGHSQVPSFAQAASRRTGTLTALATPPASSLSPPSFPQTGFVRLWRGVQTMATGCIPAHALYFSSYEYMKSIFSTKTISASGVEHIHLGTMGASLAGAVSTLAHDSIMTPLDTIKQRMQLGHYDSMGHAVQQIIKYEGYVGLYRSFGITVLTNLPYGMVMMSTNEFLREMLMEWKRPRMHVLDLETTMIAGCGAGAMAAFVTSPMDRVKTRLQTQTLVHAFPATTETIKGCPKAGAALAQASMDLSLQTAKYKNLSEAFFSIIKEEGFVGLFRGVVPRMMTHTPAIAISWTAYESGKRWLSSF